MVPQVVVLGSSGMLGQEVITVLKESQIAAKCFSRREGSENFFSFDSQSPDEIGQILNISDGAFIVNCIGWIPQKKSGVLENDTKKAWMLNVELPEVLEDLANQRGVRVIQVATDCIFDGRVGGYLESDPASAIDLYGKTKQEGEESQPSAMRIRASIIGRDRNSNSGLYSWYRSHSKDEVVDGYLNHYWNGVTTGALAKLFVGIISNQAFVPGVQHWLPQDSVSKFELLQLFREYLEGRGAHVKQAQAPHTVDRTLSTLTPTKSDEYWRLAGYSGAPSIEKLVGEMVAKDR